MVFLNDARHLIFSEIERHRFDSGRATRFGEAALVDSWLLKIFLELFLLGDSSERRHFAAFETNGTAEPMNPGRRGPPM